MKKTTNLSNLSSKKKSSHPKKKIHTAEGWIRLRKEQVKASLRPSRK